MSMSTGSSPSPRRRTIVNLTAMLLGDCDNTGLALGIAFMRCDLANRRNASRRRSRLLPGCAADELRVLARVGDLEEGRFHHGSALERYDLANRENASR